MMLADIISLTFMALLVIPWILYIFENDRKYIIWGFGLLFSQAVVKIIKHLTGTSNALYKRPDGAMNCSALNQGGPCGHCPGFPSGHVALVTAFFWLAYLFTGQVYYIILGAIISLVVAWSRIEKQCHNVVQTGAGAVAGVVSSHLWFYMTK